MNLKKRLQAAELQAAERERHHWKMFKQCQAEFGLPLPQNTPPDVLKDGERRIIALQAAIRADRENMQPAEDFRDWVASVHAEFGGEQ